MPDFPPNSGRAVASHPRCEASPIQNLSRAALGFLIGTRWALELFSFAFFKECPEVNDSKKHQGFLESELRINILSQEKRNLGLYGV